MNRGERKARLVINMALLRRNKGSRDQVILSESNGALASKPMWTISKEWLVAEWQWGLTYIAVVALVVLLIPELLLLVVVVVEVVVGVPGAADAAVGLEEPHVCLERERDAAEAGAEGGRRSESGGATRRGGRGREQDGEPDAGEPQWRRPRQL